MTSSGAKPSSSAPPGDPNQPQKPPGPSRSSRRKAKKRRNRRHSFLESGEHSDQQGQQASSSGVHLPSPVTNEPRPSIPTLHRSNTSTSVRALNRGTSGNSIPSHRPRHSPTDAHHFDALNSADPRSSFYSLGQTDRSSAESLRSETLLDHREDDASHTRRNVGVWRTGFASTGSGVGNVGEDTPLLSRRRDRERDRERSPGGARGFLAQAFGIKSGSRGSSVASSLQRRERDEGIQRTRTNSSMILQPTDNNWDVNNPPSRPNSPSVGDGRRLSSADERGDAIIDFDGALRPTDEDYLDVDPITGTPGSTMTGNLKRRMTIAAVEDVCFPQDILSEIAEEEELESHGGLNHHLNDSYFPSGAAQDSSSSRTAAAKEQQYLRERRSGSDRFGNWPDIPMLEQWAIEEQEERAFEQASTLERTRKIQEPLVVDGRLRPKKTAWHKEIEAQPYRFTYFNEEFDSTVHSQSISELVQPGQTFRDLFALKPTLLDDSDEEEEGQRVSSAGNDADRKASERANSLRSGPRSETARSTPIPDSSPPNGEKRGRYTPQPVFWLDVLCPTQAEMGVIAKAFGIHRLTVEDVMLQEAREKVELFKHYYFVNYRSFEQDRNSEEYMEPVNISFVVFHEGIISFHFSQSPHPANVRRRIRQLSDYMIPSTDWMSFAIIDDVTDAYMPLILAIEEEVDTIDQAILDMHSTNHKDDGSGGTKVSNQTDMLRHVGDCRKKVMGLYRLLGNKADVIKGFAKRCNEQWTVAPKSEIGLYLGDIQDHVLTMTSNLGYYEK
jgi:magnesium transporter